jgi:hypothetical protein
MAAQTKVKAADPEIVFLIEARRQLLNLQAAKTADQPSVLPQLVCDKVRLHGTIETL